MVLLLCAAESATVELHNRFIECWYFSDSSLNEFLHLKQFGCNRGCNNTQMEHELTKIWKENDKENDEWKKNCWKNNNDTVSWFRWKIYLLLWKFLFLFQVKYSVMGKWAFRVSILISNCSFFRKNFLFLLRKAFLIWRISI